MSFSYQKLTALTLLGYCPLDVSLGTGSCQIDLTTDLQLLQSYAAILLASSSLIFAFYFATTFIMLLNCCSMFFILVSTSEILFKFFLFSSSSFPYVSESLRLYFEISVSLIRQCQKLNQFIYCWFEFVKFKFMSESAIKKQLLEFCEMEVTPAKAVVAYDVNRWMETYSKKAHIPQPQFKTKSKPPLRVITNNFQSLSQLKRRKQALMRDTCSKDIFSILSAGTRKLNSSRIKKIDTSNQQTSSKKHYEWFRRLPIANVNQFTADSQNQTNKISLIAQSKPFTCFMKRALRRSTGKYPISILEQKQPHHRMRKTLNIVNLRA